MNENTMENANDSQVVKQNARLRKEIATYQNALEAMEIKHRAATKALRDLEKKLARICQVMKEIE